MAATRLPGTPRLLRALNDRAALELLLARGPLTRAQLGEMTGLSKVTASQLVERLEERGLVRRVGEQAGGRGPNAQLYAVTPGSAHVVGVDVGPDLVVAACADITGAVIGRVEQSTKDTDDPVGVVHNAVVQAATRAGTDMSSVRRIVLGTPGLVDPSTGDISFAFNLPRWHRACSATCATTCTPRSSSSNDVNLAAVAEAHDGAARGRRRLRPDLDQPRRRPGHRDRRPACTSGSTGAAGEIGYLPVPGAEIPRNVSRRGEAGAFQQLAGADAVRRRGPRARLPGGRARPTRSGPRSPPAPAAARCWTSWPGGWPSAWPPPAWCSTRRWWCWPARSARPADRRWPSGCSTRSPRSPWCRPRVVVTEVADEPVLHGALRTALDAVRDEVFGSTTG